MNSIIRKKFDARIMNLKNLKQIDKSSMYKVYDKWPTLAKNAFSQKFKKINLSEINHIVFAGMGGSGAIGDVFAAILSKNSIHVSVIKGYELPKTVNSKTLVITTSISGNTAETLNVLKSASKKKCKIIAFSSGGEMKKFCEEQKINHVKISMMHSPRASFSIFLYSMLNVLYPIMPLEKKDINESIQSINKTQKNISSKNLTKSNQALKIAERVKGIPIIYYPWGLQASAIRFKNSLQENSKIHVIVEDVIETGHNGITSWEKKSPVNPIMIIGHDDHEKTKQRWVIMKKYFKDRKISYVEIHSEEGNILTKVINLIYLLDYASIYKAILSKTDPTPIESIEFIKKLMKND